jgi:methylenetetrahydrofolate dehydrogenase (NAD+)
LNGKTITIINRSEVIGRPLAALLANDGAHVYSIDIDDTLEFNRGHNPGLRKHVVMDSDMTLEKVLPISDVVITGVPKANYRVKTESLKEGVVAINFSSWKNFEDDIKDKASIFVPSIGKLTTTMLQRNLLRLRFYQINKFNHEL